MNTNLFIANDYYNLLRCILPITDDLTRLISKYIYPPRDAAIDMLIETYLFCPDSIFENKTLSKDDKYQCLIKDITPQFCYTEFGTEDNMEGYIAAYLMTSKQLIRLSMISVGAKELVDKLTYLCGNRWIELV